MSPFPAPPKRLPAAPGGVPAFPLPSIPAPGAEESAVSSDIGIPAEGLGDTGFCSVQGQSVGRLAEMLLSSPSPSYGRREQVAASAPRAPVPRRDAPGRSRADLLQAKARLVVAPKEAAASSFLTSPARPLFKQAGARRNPTQRVAPREKIMTMFEELFENQLVANDHQSVRPETRGGAGHAGRTERGKGRPAEVASQVAVEPWREGEFAAMASPINPPEPGGFASLPGSALSSYRGAAGGGPAGAQAVDVSPASPPGGPFAKLTATLLVLHQRASVAAGKKAGDPATPGGVAPPAKRAGAPLPPLPQPPPLPVVAAPDFSDVVGEDTQEAPLRGRYSATETIRRAFSARYLARRGVPPPELLIPLVRPLDLPNLALLDAQLTMHMVSDAIKQWFDLMPTPFFFSQEALAEASRRILSGAPAGKDRDGGSGGQSKSDSSGPDSGLLSHLCSEFDPRGDEKRVFTVREGDTVREVTATLVPEPWFCLNAIRGGNARRHARNGAFLEPACDSACDLPVAGKPFSSSRSKRGRRALSPAKRSSASASSPGLSVSGSVSPSARALGGESCVPSASCKPATARLVLHRLRILLGQERATSQFGENGTPEAGSQDEWKRAHKPEGPAGAVGRHPLGQASAGAGAGTVAAATRPALGLAGQAQSGCPRGQPAQSAHPAQRRRILPRRLEPLGPASISLLQVGNMTDDLLLEHCLSILCTNVYVNCGMRFVYMPPHAFLSSNYRSFVHAFISSSLFPLPSCDCILFPLCSESHWTMFAYVSRAGKCGAFWDIFSPKDRPDGPVSQRERAFPAGRESGNAIDIPGGSQSPTELLSSATLELLDAGSTTEVLSVSQSQVPPDAAVPAVPAVPAASPAEIHENKRRRRGRRSALPAPLSEVVYFDSFNGDISQGEAERFLDMLCAMGIRKKLPTALDAPAPPCPPERAHARPPAPARSPLAPVLQETQELVPLPSQQLWGHPGPPGSSQAADVAPALAHTQTPAQTQTQTQAQTQTQVLTRIATQTQTQTQTLALSETQHGVDALTARSGQADDAVGPSKELEGQGTSESSGARKASRTLEVSNVSDPTEGSESPDSSGDPGNAEAPNPAAKRSGAQAPSPPPTQAPQPPSDLFSVQDIYRVRLPQQTNLYDCAIYLLVTVLMLSQPAWYPKSKGDCRSWYKKTAVPAMRLWFAAYILCCGEGRKPSPGERAGRAEGPPAASGGPWAAAGRGGPASPSPSSSDLEILSD